MNVIQIALGRFHHFHLARQMERFGLLEAIYTAYPSFKLKDENSISKTKIKTFPWIHTPYMLRGKIKLDKFEKLNKNWEWLDRQSLDKYVARKITKRGLLIALSGCGLNAGKKMQTIGGRYICDRGSSHIVYQNEILKEEYKIWGYEFKGIDIRIIEKELQEYESADAITVPSEFVRNSFIENGIAENKIVKIPYGARLDRFSKVGEPCDKKFTVLWVGGVSIRKGFMYALRAFQLFKFSKKEFIVIGAIETEIEALIANENLSNVKFLGKVPNSELSKYYSSAHVFLIASLEEGLAMVQGEAMACGCPIIATANTGSADIFTDGKEGFIVPIRSTDAILERLYSIAQDKQLRESMSYYSELRVKQLGGWDTYGANFLDLINSYKK